MKKGIKILCLIIALGAVFLLGWRVMPQAWPGIKEAVVYPVFPQMRPAPDPTPAPYQPKSTGEWGAPVSASDSVIYYFYKDYCVYCRELEPLTAGLPKTVTLPDGVQSAVKLICLNKVEETSLQVITDYYEAHGVPENERYVPAIVIGDRYLFLGREIIDQLMDALLAGEGLNTPLLDGGQRI